MKNPKPLAVWILVAMLILLSLGALPAGALFIAAPDGRLMGMPLSALSRSPFTSFLVPGLSLFTFLGVYPLIVAYGLLRKPGWKWAESLNPFKSYHWSFAAALAAGFAVEIWIGVQIWAVGYVSFLQPFYLVWGLVMLILTLSRPVRVACRT